MNSNVIRTSTVNGQRIELVGWDDMYSVYIYDQEGRLCGGARNFYAYFAAEQFYLDGLSRLAGSTP